MKNRKIYTFPTDVFYKLQDFLSELILEKMNSENPNYETIDKLNNMQYYLAEFHKDVSDDNSIEIELNHDDYEFLFNRLLIPAIYSFDWKHLCDKYDELCEKSLFNFDSLHEFVNKQSSLITKQSEFIDFLMGKDNEVENC